MRRAPQDRSEILAMPAVRAISRSPSMLLKWPFLPVKMAFLPVPAHCVLRVAGRQLLSTPSSRRTPASDESWSPSKPRAPFLAGNRWQIECKWNLFAHDGCRTGRWQDRLHIPPALEMPSSEAQIAFLLQRRPNQPAASKPLPSRPRLIGSAIGVMKETEQGRANIWISGEPRSAKDHFRPASGGNNNRAIISVMLLQEL